MYSCPGPKYARMCYAPPPTPGLNGFRCDVINCSVGVVCVSPVWTGDMCKYHRCAAAPAPCDVNTTCACLESNNLVRGTNGCSQDAMGNVFVEDTGLTW